MGLLRGIFISVVSLSLLACSNGDEDEYEGPAQLTNGQKLIAATTVSSMNAGADKLERVAEVLVGDKEADQDILELVEILLSCEAQKEGGSGDNFIVHELTISGEGCPVQYRKYSYLNIKKVGDDHQLVSGVDETTFNTDHNGIISLIDVKSADVRITFNENQTYSMNARVELGSLGSVSIIDEMTRSIAGSIETYTFFRKMNVDGFTVEARVIIKAVIETGELKGLDLLINGQRVSAEEMTSIYPIPFEWFEDGKSFRRVLP